jgi:hypothetical protein
MIFSPSHHFPPCGPDLFPPVGTQQEAHKKKYQMNQNQSISSYRPAPHNARRSDPVIHYYFLKEWDRRHKQEIYEENGIFGVINQTEALKNGIWKPLSSVLGGTQKDRKRAVWFLIEKNPAQIHRSGRVTFKIK